MWWNELLANSDGTYLRSVWSKFNEDFIAVEEASNKFHGVLFIMILGGHLLLSFGHIE